MATLKQRGRNSNYPETCETWKYGEKIPDWLSDKAKINAIDSRSGNPELDLIETKSGGYEIRTSSGENVLLKTKSRSDLVCYSPEKGIFVLTEEQANLIY